MASASDPRTKPILRASESRGLGVRINQAAQLIHSTVTTRWATRKPLRAAPARSPITTPAATTITEKANSAATAPAITTLEACRGTRRDAHHVAATASAVTASAATTSQ